MPPDYLKSEGFWSWRRWTAAVAAPAAGLAVIALVQLAAFPAGYVGKEHDDALYVLASQSLLEGRYRMWFIPGRPPNTQTTPGLPALLLPAAWLAPENLLGYQFLAFLLLLLTDAALWYWLRRRFSAPAATALTALALLNPLVLARVGVVMPEVPFLSAALAVLLVWDRPGWAWGTGVLLLAAYLIRPAALPLWLAVGLALAFRRRWMDLAKAAVFPALGYALWRAWSRQGGGIQENLELAKSYGTQFFLNGFHIAAANLGRIADTMGAPFLPLSAAGTPAAAVLGGVLLALSTAGAFRLLRRDRAEPAALFLILSLAMHVFWPWWYFRYLVPLLPFLLWTGTALCPRPLPRRAAAVILAWCVVIFQWSAQGRYWTFAGRAGQPEMADTYAWVRANTPPETRLAGLLYGRDVLYTGRVVLPLPSYRSGEEFRGALRRAHVRYVLWEDRRDFGFSLARDPALNDIGKLRDVLESSGGFAPAFDDPAGRTRVFELR